MDREAWHAAVLGSQRVGHDWVTELNWGYTSHFIDKEAEVERADISTNKDII